MVFCCCPTQGYPERGWELVLRKKAHGLVPFPTMCGTRLIIYHIFYVHNDPVKKILVYVEGTLPSIKVSASAIFHPKHNVAQGQASSLLTLSSGMNHKCPKIYQFFMPSKDPMPALFVLGSKVQCMLSPHLAQPHSGPSTPSGSLTHLPL
jgi:hypothetical protein